MTRKAVFVAFIACLTLGSLRAQHSAISPYSSYAYGDRRYNADAIIAAMGGVGVNFFDTDHINTSNPASYARLRLTTYQLGINTDASYFRTAVDSDRRSSTYVSQAQLALPFKRSALLMGFAPFSAVGYDTRQVSDSDQDTFTAYSALGGLDMLLMGYAYQITEHISLGIHAAYLFGRVERHIISKQSQAQLLTDQGKTLHAKGAYFQGGLLYTTAVGHGKRFDLGATYAFGAPIRTKTDRLVYTFQYAGDGTGKQLPQDTILQRQGLSGTLDLPARAALALGWHRPLKFGYGVQADFENFENFKVDGKKQSGLKNSLRFGLGGYWIPKYNSFRSYFSRVTYRFGAFYENTMLQLNTQRIRDFGITFGFGLPVGHEERSNLNLGFLLGRRGTVEQGLIEENYLGLRLSLSFNDKWFRKRQYD